MNEGLAMKYLKMGSLIACLAGLTGCSDDVASVSLGLFTTKDVVVN